MSDIATIWNGTSGDWVLAGADLETGDDLATAGLISLFSDATASPDDTLPDGGGDPRGWWGDAFADKPIGSRIWLYSRAKATTDTANGVRDAAKRALQWFVDDGVAARLDVVAAWQGPNFLGVTADLFAADGAKIASLKYGWAWQGVS